MPSDALPSSHNNNYAGTKRVGVTTAAQPSLTMVPSAQPPPAAPPDCRCGQSAIWLRQRWWCANEQGESGGCGFEMRVPPPSHLQAPLCLCGHVAAWDRGYWWCAVSSSSYSGFSRGRSCDFMAKASTDGVFVKRCAYNNSWTRACESSTASAPAAATAAASAAHPPLSSSSAFASSAAAAKDDLTEPINLSGLPVLKDMLHDQAGAAAAADAAPLAAAAPAAAFSQLPYPFAVDVVD